VGSTFSWPPVRAGGDTGGDPRALRGACPRTVRQVLLGVTGSGKTYTMASVIAPSTACADHRPEQDAAAQLYSEFRSLFPENAVEYFVSYYDYYQPRRTFPTRTPTSRRTPQSTSRSTRCAQRHEVVMTRGDVIVIAPCRASTASGPRSITADDVRVEAGGSSPATRSCGA